MFSKNLVYRFATKAFDLAVIGGGPGGTSHFIQVMLQPLRQLNSVSILYVFKKEEV